ncbi:hypothetical protein SBA1_450003 [Candidatus Sulfotelmatobacter kueseliae]|uniref:Uncharacterized protein n=1 Tax=Candidatus Sulfotelmatobacter kueseliae TaxID=2042962 RepID=A0A2U3KS56_9BACT|nr:hypothetical protein SBA1_450003 [Candidatus Sulfotelmatobacter kueseliae]
MAFVPHNIFRDELLINQSTKQKVKMEQFNQFHSEDKVSSECISSHLLARFHVVSVARGCDEVGAQPLKRLRSSKQTTEI